LFSDAAMFAVCLSMLTGHEDRPMALLEHWDRLSNSPLAMTSPVADTPTDIEFGSLREPSASEYRLLAARKRQTPAGLNEALAVLHHDVAGMIVAQAPADAGDGLGQWKGLFDCWSEAMTTPSPTKDLAEALIFTAQTTDVEAPDCLAETLKSALPVDTGLLDHPPFITEENILVWASSLTENPRVVVMVAPNGVEDSLDDWIWRARDRLPSFVAYLASSAKVRYELGVRRQLSDLLMAGRQELDSQIDAIFDQHLLDGSDDPHSLDLLLDANTKMRKAQAQAAGLTLASSRLRELERTVTIALHNMQLHRPSGHLEDARGAPTYQEIDEQITDWLVGQAAHDVGYAEVAQQRAHEIYEATALRLMQATEEHNRRREHLLVLQTMLVTAAGTAVVAYQATLEWTLAARIALTAGIVLGCLLLVPKGLRLHERLLARLEDRGRRKRR
jgi:hypothetical protein